MGQETNKTYKVGFETEHKYLTELNLQPFEDVLTQTDAKDYAQVLKNAYYDLVDTIIRGNYSVEEANRLFKIRVLFEAFEEIGLTDRRGE